LVLNSGRRQHTPYLCAHLPNIHHFVSSEADVRSSQSCGTQKIALTSHQSPLLPSIP
jgi:hypothetical protein